HGECGYYPLYHFVALTRSQFQRCPQRGIVGERKVGGDGKGLFAQLQVADGVEETEARVLGRVEAIQRRRGNERLQAVTALDAHDAQQDLARRNERRVLQRSIDFRLQDQWLV